MNGELDLFEPATGEGMLTDKYLEDRADFFVLRNNLFAKDALVQENVVIDDLGPALGFVVTHQRRDRSALGGQNPDEGAEPGRAQNGAAYAPEILATR